MEFGPEMFWNIIITLVLAPIFYSIRQNTTEAKRLDILLNKTREELAKDYVTKNESREVMNDYSTGLKSLTKRLTNSLNYGRIIMHKKKNTATVVSISVQEVPVSKLMTKLRKRKEKANGKKK